MDRITSLYDNGIGTEKISKLFGVSKRPINRVLTENKMLRDGYSDGKKIIISKCDELLIKEMYLNEYNNSYEIALKLSLSQPFVAKFLNNSGYRRNKSEGNSIGTVKRYGGDYLEYLENRTEYKTYFSKVMVITNKQDIKNLTNYNKRGVSGIKGVYQLDHKYSIYEGFKNNIEPMIMGNINNLEFLPWEENARKRTKCSISIKQLKNI